MVFWKLRSQIYKILDRIDICILLISGIPSSKFAGSIAYYTKVEYIAICSTSAPLELAQTSCTW